mgnify:FL=1
MKGASPQRIVALSVLILLALVGGALADNSGINQSHLAPVVNNAASCSSVVNPGQSIQTAIANSQSGQVICVRGGTYQERVQIRPANSGLTLQAYPGERPIIDGRSSIPSSRFDGLLTINGSNVTVEGFEVRNSAGRGILVAQVSGDSRVLRDVIVRNNVVRGAYDMGINVNGTTAQRPFNILIENNSVYDNLLKNAGGTDSGGSAIVFVDVNDSTARGNMVYHNLGEGLVADRWTSGLVFEDNIVYDNKHSNVYLSTTQNPLVQRNLIFCTNNRDYWRGKTYVKPVPGITLRDEDYEGQTTKPPASSGQVIINNIVIGCGNNFLVSTQFAGGGLNNAVVANNSFINARGESGAGAMNVLFEGDANYKNSRFVNNLILQTDPTGQLVRILLNLGTPDMSSFAVANNLYSSAPGKNWITNEPGRVVANPQLVNPVMPTSSSGIPDPANYALQASSPAINAGTSASQVLDDFFKRSRSGALDIGAAEHGSGGGNSVTPPPTATPPATATPPPPTGTPPPPTATPVATGTAAPTTEPTSGRITVRKETIPAGDAQSFDFTSNYAGSFQLAHNGQKSTDLVAGTYSVSETIPTGWTQVSASCSDGSSPGAINLEQGETVTCTFVNQKEEADNGPLESAIYVTTNTAGTVGGVAFQKGDILAYDGRNDAWSIYFDASDVGILNSLNDFLLMPDGSILLAISGRTTLAGSSGSFKLQLWDVAQFIPRSLGADTAGHFAMYIDGSDVGLTQASEKIDALARHSNGTILISTYGAASVPNGSSVVKAQDEDLLAFQPSRTGDTTQGSWSLAFDGSKIAGMGVEDVTGAWHDANTGDHYLTLTNGFNVGGVTGGNGTILSIAPAGAAKHFWNAADAGFTWPVTGIHIVP